jgi:hypothetical protein
MKRRWTGHSPAYQAILNDLPFKTRSITYVDVCALSDILTAEINMRQLPFLTLAFGILGLTSCAQMIPAAPQTGTQLSCSHFSKQADGTWRGDGNAVAEVDGKTWSLGTEKFNRNGPLVGGVNLYNVLQNRCAAKS